MCSHAPPLAPLHRKIQAAGSASFDPKYDWPCQKQSRQRAALERTRPPLPPRTPKELPRGSPVSGVVRPQFSSAWTAEALPCCANPISILEVSRVQSGGLVCNRTMSAVKPIPGHCCGHTKEPASSAFSQFLPTSFIDNVGSMILCLGTTPAVQ